MTSIKKIAIIFLLFKCIAASVAHADIYAETIQVECIPELQYLEIRAKTISGKEPVDYLGKHTKEIENLSGIYDLTDIHKEPFQITCTPSDGKYEVTIAPNYLQDEHRVYVGSRTAMVTVKYDGKIVIDNLTLRSGNPEEESIETITFKMHEGYYILYGYKPNYKLEYPDNDIFIHRIVDYK